jgi:hypothetical protein
MQRTYAAIVALSIIITSTFCFNAARTRSAMALSRIAPSVRRAYHRILCIIRCIMIARYGHKQRRCFGAGEIACRDVVS